MLVPIYRQNIRTIIIIIILFVHKNNFIKTWQPTTRERDRQGLALTVAPIKLRSPNSTAVLEF